MLDDRDQRTLAGHLNQWAGDGPVWCLVATMGQARPFGLHAAETGETRAGTAHFAPGARLYLRHIINYDQTRHGKDDMSVEVVGRHRATRRYVRLIVRASWLENWHVDLVYSPTVIRLLLPYWDGTEASRARAAEYGAIFAARDAPADA